MHLVGEKESSPDENFDLVEHTIQYDESKEGSEYKSAQEDDASVDDSAEHPMEYAQRPLLLRELNARVCNHQTDKTTRNSG